MNDAPEKLNIGKYLGGRWFAFDDGYGEDYIRRDIHEVAVAAARVDAINMLLDEIGTVEGRRAANIRSAARKLRSRFIAEASK